MIRVVMNDKVYLADRVEVKTFDKTIKPIIKKGGLGNYFVFEDKEQPIMKAFFVQEMLEKGFLASNLFYSMFAHTKKDVEAYLVATGEVFGRIKHLKDAGKLRTALKGKPSVAGFKRIT